MFSLLNKLKTFPEWHNLTDTNTSFVQTENNISSIIQSLFDPKMKTNYEIDNFPKLIQLLRSISDSFNDLNQTISFINPDLNHLYKLYEDFQVKRKLMQKIDTDYKNALNEVQTLHNKLIQQQLNSNTSSDVIIKTKYAHENAIKNESTLKSVWETQKNEYEKDFEIYQKEVVRSLTAIFGEIAKARNKYSSTIYDNISSTVSENLCFNIRLTKPEPTLKRDIQKLQKIVNRNEENMSKEVTFEANDDEMIIIKEQKDFINSFSSSDNDGEIIEEEEEESIVVTNPEKPAQPIHAKEDAKIDQHTKTESKQPNKSLKPNKNDQKTHITPQPENIKQSPKAIQKDQETNRKADSSLPLNQQIKKGNKIEDPSSFLCNSNMDLSPHKNQPKGKNNKQKHQNEATTNNHDNNDNDNLIMGTQAILNEHKSHLPPSKPLEHPEMDLLLEKQKNENKNVQSYQKRVNAVYSLQPKEDESSCLDDVESLSPSAPKKAVPNEEFLIIEDEEKVPPTTDNAKQQGKKQKKQQQQQSQRHKKEEELKLQQQKEKEIEEKRRKQEEERQLQLQKEKELEEQRKKDEEELKLQKQKEKELEEQRRKEEEELREKQRREEEERQLQLQKEKELEEQRRKEEEELREKQRREEEELKLKKQKELEEKQRKEEEERQLQLQKEKELQEKKKKEQELKEQQQKKELEEKKKKEQELKEKQRKEKEQKEKQKKDQNHKDKHKKDLDTKEKQQKEQELKEQQIREQQQREKELMEQLQKEQEILNQQQKEQESKQQQQQQNQTQKPASNPFLDLKLLADEVLFENDDGTIKFPASKNELDDIIVPPSIATATNNNSNEANNNDNSNATNADNNNNNANTSSSNNGAAAPSNKAESPNANANKAAAPSPPPPAAAASSANNNQKNKKQKNKRQKKGRGKY